MFKSRNTKIGVSLAIVVLLSSFFLPVYLQYQIAHNTISPLELDIATKLQLKGVNRYQLAQLKEGSSSWIQLAKRLSKTEGDISYNLAQYYQKNKNDKSAIRWFTQAIFLDYQPAIMALANLYIEQNELKFARDVISQFGHQSANFLLDELILAIAQGDIEFVKNNLSHLPVSEQTKNLKAKIVEYKIIYDNPTADLLTHIEEGSDKTCPVSLQLFATTLADLDSISQLKSEFLVHPLHKFICLATPRYIAINELSCSHQPDEAIKCQESVWSKLGINENNRFIGLLHPAGGANVHLGILYFDREDTIEVLAHEISHLVGFVDEYPLPKSHHYCRQNDNDLTLQTLSHNAALFKQAYQGERQTIRQQLLSLIPWAKFIKPTTPILSEKYGNYDGVNNTNLAGSTWIVGTPQSYNTEIGLFKSDTCQQSELQSFKPLKGRTQLEYYELSFPKAYDILLSDSNNNYLMPSFHYNVALALLLKGELEQGKSWLFKAAALEKENTRKLKILQGKF